MRRTPVTRTPVPLDEFADVLTNEDICAVLGFGPRYMERKTGERCTPVHIPVLGSARRYRKDDVKRWLKSGIPEAARLDKVA